VMNATFPATRPGISISLSIGLRRCPTRSLLRHDTRNWIDIDVNIGIAKLKSRFQGPSRICLVTITDHQRLALRERARSRRTGSQPRVGRSGSTQPRPLTSGDDVGHGART
jgi:hypothetical protein